MKFAQIIVFLFVIVVKCNCSTPTLDVVRFLNDIHDYYETPTKFLFSTCWDVEYLGKLWESLPTTIGYQGFKNITFVQPDGLNHIAFVVDSTCTKAENFIKSTPPLYYNHPFRWIIIDDDRHEKFNNLPALPDSHIILARPAGVDKQSLILQKIYRIEKNSRLIVEPFGTWNQAERLQVPKYQHPISASRRDLAGKKFNVSMVFLSKDSLNHLHDYKDKHVDTVSKLNYRLTEHLIDSLNATAEYGVMDTWETADPNTGKVRGLVVEIAEKRVEIGGTPFFILARRVPMMDYLSMTTPTIAKFLFRAPPLSTVSNIYALPFNSTVWMCSGALVTMAVIVMFIIYKWHDRHTVGRDQMTSRLTDFALSGISIICQMGSCMQPRADSARISTIFLLAGILFLYTSYTASIVALLQSSADNIKTLPDLLHSKLSLGIEDTPYYRMYFKIARGSARQAIFRKALSKKNKGGFMNQTHGINRMRKELFAFHIELGSGYKVIEDTFLEHEKCNIKGVEYLEFRNPWIAIPKNSSYKEMIKVSLFKIREYGLQFREYNSLYTKKPLCTASNQNWVSVHLTHSYAAFMILLFGCGIALVIFFLEKIAKNHQICTI